VWESRARIALLFTVRSLPSSSSIYSLTPPIVVVPGDTCDAIAAMHGTNTTFLYQNNPQIHPGCNNIYIGEVLCAANSVIVPPTGGNPVAPPPNATPAVPSNTLPTTTPPPPPPASTPPASTPASQPPATPTQDDSGDDGDDDDEDLPYCDEL
jgi:LysM repeat protein